VTSYAFLSPDRFGQDLSTFGHTTVTRHPY